MASAKFLEEALSTDVDESAVNAIVGSLETQLVSSTPPVTNFQGETNSEQQNHINSTISNGGSGSSVKHGVSNGGATTSMNIILNNTDGEKQTNSAETHHNTVVGCLPSGSVSSGPFINQVTNNLSLVQTNLTTNVNVNNSNKHPQEGVKLVFPSNSQSNVTTVNNRVCYASQSVSLPNGTISSSTTNSEVQTSSSAQVVVAGAGGAGGVGVVVKTTPSSGMDQTKPTGTALVIKSGVNSSHSGTPITTMTLPGSTNSIGVATAPTASVVTLAKPLNQVGGQPTAIVGATPQIVPANVQILNVNALRTAAPVQQGAKGLPSHVMIGTPQMVGGRQVQPGQIRLQTLQGLAPGAQGHLLLKTENGQYQLLRVGPPAPSPAQPGQTATITGNNVSTFRVQAIANAANTGAAVQTQVPALATQGTVTGATNTVTRGPADQTKDKCRKFLANLLELSSREPKAVERNVRTLIQELIDTKVEPEQFCDRLERLLNASPQPCLIGFLKKSLPLLRLSMVNNELVIDGIRPPPPSVVFSTTPTPTIVTTTQPQQVQIRGPIQMATTPQMRIVQPSAVRPGQQIQHRIITPVRVATGQQLTAVNKSTVTAIRTQGTIVRPATQIVRTPTGPTITLRPGQTLAKAQFTTRPVLATSASFNQHPKPTTVFVPNKVQPVAKEKEKKTFSSTGYMGDDDINDVAAMGGVNLAEESQRILGSTEFVGTKIRSCKDDIFLHSNPLMNKLAQIASKHGLEEPNPDVAALISHATQERLKDLVEKLAIIAEHRIDLNKADPRYDVTQDVRAQLKCLEEIDRAERKRHEEQERELLIRAAKSRTKPEDPEQAKLKAKAKEMQRAEMEELRQREANLTALLAIGPRKKPKMDESAGTPSTLGTSSTSTPTIPLRPRVKRVCLRDLLMVMEQEKETCRSLSLYKSYLK